MAILAPVETRVRVNDDMVLVHSYFKGHANMMPRELQTTAETAIRAQRAAGVRKAAYILGGWAGGAAFDYLPAPPFANEAAANMMARSHKGSRSRMLLNMCVLKALHAAQDTADGVVSAAQKPHLEPAWFFDSSSTEWCEDGTLEFLRYGPTNKATSWNMYGQAELTAQGTIPTHNGSRLFTDSIFYKPNSGSIMTTDMLHWVTPPLDNTGQVDPTGERGLAFFAYDHRLKPAA